MLERIRGENIIRLTVRPFGLLAERASHCKTFCNSPKLSKCGPVVRASEPSPLGRVTNSTSLKLPEAKHIVRKILEGEKCRRFCLTIYIGRGESSKSQLKLPNRARLEEGRASWE